MNDKDERDGDGPVKVVDRRSFTATGERRPAADPTTPPRSASDDAAPATRPPGRRDAEPATVAPEAPQASIDFIAFAQSLYVGALMALGEVENPYTHQFETNLDLARQNVDILTMLTAKTRGNLTPAEHSFLEQAVPQLQLLYVKKVG